jgi:ribulose-5-phosphate 4-epimerase/fuculose-1-phosphate aldolase
MPRRITPMEPPAMSTASPWTENFVATARRAAEIGLLRSTCGNLSVRVGKDSFAVSCSGSYLGQLTPADVTTVDLHDTTRFQGKKPSSETGFHQQIYLNRPEINAVLHFQSLAATTMACARDWDFDLNVIPEVPVYVRAVAFVPYLLPGSSELADAVGHAVKGSDARVVVLRNHGQIALAESTESVLRAAEFFEFAAAIACQGVRLRSFTPAEMQDLGRYR